MRPVLCLLICFVVTWPAQAEIMIGHTAESISHDSTLIALATPVEAEDIKGPGEVWFTKTRFKLTEVLKGPESTGDSVTVYDYSYKKADVVGLKKAVKQATPTTFLVFARVSKNNFGEIDGKYVLTLVHESKSAYPKGEKVAALFTPGQTILTSFEDLLKRARDQVAEESRFLKTYPEGKVEMMRVEVSFNSEAFKHLYAGSTCYVFVPDYVKPKGRE